MPGNLTPQGVGSDTQGTETSQYLEEEKEPSNPVVAASEPGRAQTDAVQACWRCSVGVTGLTWAGQQTCRGVTNLAGRGSAWNGAPQMVKAQYLTLDETPWSEFPSTTGHVEPCRKSAGPPAKAKYSLVTDSALVP